MCNNYVVREQEGKTNWSHTVLKAHQQRRTRGTIEISRGMHGITFEWFRTFQQKKIRAKKLLAKVAGALVEERSDCIRS